MAASWSRATAAVLAVLAAVSVLVTGRPALEKPNIVMLFEFVDGLGYGDLGFTGHPTVHSPNIDSLAPLSNDVFDHLTSNGVRRVAVGHKPYGDSPGVMHLHSGRDDANTLEVVCADTSFSDMSCADNRGAAASEVCNTAAVSSVVRVCSRHSCACRLSCPAASTEGARTARAGGSVGATRCLARPARVSGSVDVTRCSCRRPTRA